MHRLHIALLLSLIPLSARADEGTGDLEGLLSESVVSTASKSAERASTAPAQIINITSEQIRAFGVRSVAEALNYLGVAMYAARTGEALQHTGVTTEVGSRGVMFQDGGSRVLVLLDGHTTNSQIDGRSFIDGTLGVPIELIDHIEVVLGPGSVMYGSSAFLGVVNVVTKRARDLKGVAGSAQVILQPPQGSDRNLTSAGNGDSLGWTYRFALSLGHEFTIFHQQAEFVAQGEWIVGQSGSYRVGPQYGTYPLGIFPATSGPWQGAVSDSVNAPALVATLRIGDWRLAAHVNSYTRGAPLIGGLGLPGNGGNTRHFGLDLSNSTQIGGHFTLSSRLYADATEQTVNQMLSGTVGSEFGQGAIFQDQLLSQWLGLEEQGIVNWRSDGSLVTTIGFDVRGRRSMGVDSRQRDPVTQYISQLNPETYINNMSALGGLYLQQVYQPLQWLGLNAGLRVDVDQLFGAHLSPRAALVITEWPGNTIKLMYAEAFRAPTPDQVYDYGIYTLLRPTNLQPEVLRSIEAEVSQRWSSGRATLNGFLSFYEAMISNREATDAEYGAALAAGLAVSAVPAAGYQTLANLGSMQGFGASLSIEQRLPWGLRGALNALLSSTSMSSTTGQPQVMIYTPSWFGNARLLWQPRPEGPSLAFACNLLGPRNPQLGSYVPAPTMVMPASADLRLTGVLPIAGLPGLSARLIADYNTEGRAPIQVGGPSLQAPTAPAELIPLPRAFFLAEVRYER